MTNSVASSVTNIVVGGTPMFTTPLNSGSVVSLYMTATAAMSYSVFLRKNNTNYPLIQGQTLANKESRVHEGIFVPAGVTLIIAGANAICSCVGYSYTLPDNFDSPAGKTFGVLGTKVNQSNRIVFDMAEFAGQTSVVAEGSLFLNGTGFTTTTTKIYAANVPVTNTSELLPDVYATFRTPARVSHARINTWMMKSRYLVVITQDPGFAGYLQYNLRKGV